MNKRVIMSIGIGILLLVSIALAAKEDIRALLTKDTPRGVKDIIDQKIQANPQQVFLSRIQEIVNEQKANEQKDTNEVDRE